ncbi:MAG: extracellular solute-binding protein [Pseudomonadota bacterium]
MAARTRLQTTPWLPETLAGTLLTPLAGTLARTLARILARTLVRILAGTLALFVGLFISAGVAMAQPAHGIAMHGTPALGPDFTHFPHAHPDAPQGGTLRLGRRGSFDSLNPLIDKGAVAPGMRGYVYESLLARNLSEPFALYGLLAEKVEVPDDRSWVAFTLNPRARFSDGRPVTVEDVIHSHAILKEKGRNNHRIFYSKVTKVSTPGERTVRFDFANGTDRELALILGLMPVVPKHALSIDALQKTSLSPPIGSGPYLVGKVDAGRSIEYRRNPDYWGRDVPAMRGRHNFDVVRYEFFRDVNTLREAFAKGVYDVRSEGDPAQWATAYDFPAVERGDVKKVEFPVALPSGMSGLAFNTRRAIFADRRVREALTYVYDFEWLNRTLYHGLYTRTQSFFDRSAMTSHAVAMSEEEKALLGVHADALPAALVDGTYAAPKSDGRGRNRNNIRRAIALLRESGYQLADGVMRNRANGEPLRFEILIATQPQQKMLGNFRDTLRRIGIDVRIRQVDSSEYTRRRRTFDFDMIPFTWAGSLSPGNEQYYRWGSAAADTDGSFNVTGAKDPAIDRMIDALVAARDRPAFETAVRAYDRVLLAGQYAIPLFHLKTQWVAHWSYLAYPETTSLYGYQLDTWWDTRAAGGD